MVRGFFNVLIGLKINVYNWFDTREYDECRIVILKVSIRELGVHCYRFTWLVRGTQEICSDWPF